MNISPREIALSWIFTLGTILILWPPNHFYWAYLGEIIINAIEETVQPGTTAIIMVVIGLLSLFAIISILTVSLGLAFNKHTHTQIHNLLIGNIIAYINVLVIAKMTTSPTSLTYLILYGILLLGIIGGELTEYHFTKENNSYKPNIV